MPPVHLVQIRYQLNVALAYLVDVGPVLGVTVLYFVLDDLDEQGLVLYGFMLGDDEIF